MPVTTDQVLEALRKVQEPELHRDLVSLNMIRDLQVGDSSVRFTLVLTTPACPFIPQMQADAQAAVQAIPGVSTVQMDTVSNVRSSMPRMMPLLPGVKNTIAVASNKGGVGKSTVAVNLAVALAQSGARVGLLDSDITGPNIPLMMGAQGQPKTDGKKMIPLERHGVKLISIGLLVPEGTPLVWRGPMVAKALQQFLEDVLWGELDYLVIDLPPGTGDASLSAAQLIPLSGTVIVTTPQAVSLQDVERALGMFRKLEVPILGIVENMSYFLCPHCGQRTEVFSHGGGTLAAQRLSVPLLGEVPLDPTIREGGDDGWPIVVRAPQSPPAEIFRRIAGLVAARISVQAFQTKPKIVISAG